MFCCHGSQSFWRNKILSKNSEEDQARNIFVKFHQNGMSSFISLGFMVSDKKIFKDLKKNYVLLPWQPEFLKE